MTKGILAIVLLAVIGAAGYWIAAYGDGKFWNKPVREDPRAKVSYKGKLLRDWVAEIESEDVALRRETAQALMSIPPKDGQYIIAALINGVSDADNLTRARATTALGRILSKVPIPAPPDAVVPTSQLLKVTEVLKDPDPVVRCAGAEALASFGGRLRDAAPALADVAKNDQDAQVREAAAAALEKIQPGKPAAPTSKSKVEPARAETKKS